MAVDRTPLTSEQEGANTAADEGIVARRQHDHSQSATNVHSRERRDSVIEPCQLLLGDFLMVGRGMIELHVVCTITRRQWFREVGCHVCRGWREGGGEFIEVLGGVT